ncbi:efflux RND transporter periplasmic adaptor subunit [Phenylobacterium sp.]|uniref:efflux RND transporter periplasmic adaptor subunit n=1 Tax=Phenylobacterium sp. TaxID=1871053 RepID=UPI003983BE6F
MSPTPAARRRLLGLSRPLLIALGVIALVLAAVVACQMRPTEPKDPYRFAAVERGAITRAVSASGTLEALVTVEVGSQISGLIRQVLVDFNDQVRAGQTLATLDPQTYESRVAQGQADVSAGVASLRQAQAQLANSQADFNRKKELVSQGIYSPSVLDQSTAAFRNAQAGVEAARARIGQSQASLRSQRVDLSRTTIVSPIDGVVVDRTVEPGQTVAASFQAPVLFRIAQDLSKVQVKISVDEADIGQVQEGQRVRFTVDAFPDDNFEGVVTQVRKQPTTEQNVVAYTVIAEADNPQGRLLPGMTANADIVLEIRPNVLKVPAAALRWTPPSENAGPRAGGLGGPPGGGAGVGGPGGGGQGAQRGGMGRVVEQLDLDAGQRRKWDAIQAEMRTARQSAMASAGSDRAKLREAMRKSMADAFARLEPSLKPAQKAKLTVLRATLAQGGGARGGLRGGVVHVLRDEKPTPLAVRVGVTDGTNTEIIGPLKAGDQVIVGGGPKGKIQARVGFGGGPPGSGGGGGPNRMRM